MESVFVLSQNCYMKRGIKQHRKSWCKKCKKNCLNLKKVVDLFIATNLSYQSMVT